MFQNVTASLLANQNGILDVYFIIVLLIYVAEIFDGLTGCTPLMLSLSLSHRIFIYLITSGNSKIIFVFPGEYSSIIRFKFVFI